MSSSAPSKPTPPWMSHFAVVDELFRRGKKPWPRDVREEAMRELDRYWDQGVIIQDDKDRRMVEPFKPMTRSGSCAYESPGSHASCPFPRIPCSCECHNEPKNFSGQGILFAVIDDRENMRMGRTTTISVIADAIEKALDAGKETSDQIARYLTTSAFQHEPDRRVKFNSILKAGDGVGAHLVKKLINSYNELMATAEGEKNAAAREALEHEATGFAEAIQVVLNPFSVEDPNEPTLVSWDEVDRLTELFVKEQRTIRNYKEK